MKKIVTLLLAAGLVFSAVNSASAVEVKASGMMDFTFEGHQNINGDRSFMDADDARDNGLGELHQKHSGAVQRFRLGLDFIMDENLSAHYQAQVGTFTWGGPNSPAHERAGGALGTRASNIVTRLAYLDWMIPTTNVHVRMGQQAVAMPSFTFGSPVLDDTATGIVISAPVTDNIGLTGFWARALSDSRRGNANSLGVRTNDNLDLFGGIADFKYDGFALSPWFIVGPMGEDAGSNMQGYLTPVWAVPTGNSFVWFAGIGGELTRFDPFRFTADFYYSALEADDNEFERNGWYASVGAEYATAFGTPALKGWYATGDNDNADNGSEQPLTISGGFNATSTYFDGRYSIANTIDRADAAGTWGVSLQWNDLSFIESLSHDASVTYIRGTNSRGGTNFVVPSEVTGPASYLSRKDSLIELDFDTTYMIYSNLATVLELSYIIEDFDDGDWGNRYELADDASFSNAWRAALNFRYTF